MDRDEFTSDKSELLFPVEENPISEPVELNTTDHNIKPWKLLIVDDDEEVHSATRLALKNFEFEGAGLEIQSAYTGAEALQKLKNDSETAVILLDVVMENPSAGLDCAQAIRQELHNKLVRIILRTGQPGSAPERSVIIDYDINDYKNKTELTSQRLFTAVYTAIRSYRDMLAIDKQRKGLQYIIDASGDFFKQTSLKKLSKGVLTLIESIFRLQNTLYISGTGFSATQDTNQGQANWKFIAATGKFASCQNEGVCEQINHEIDQRLREVAERRESMFIDNDYIGYFPTHGNKHHIVYMENCGRYRWEEVQNLLEIFTSNVGIAFDNIYLNQEIIDTQTEIVMRLGQVVEERSKETAYHVFRVAEYIYTLAKALGLDEEEAKTIKLASPMHDIGKIGIPDSVLLKPGKLNDEEWAVMKTHANIGYNILGGSERTLLKTAAIIALTHHERWDGNGYPNGMKGEDIPLAGRLTALADIFDALGSDRVYKKAWPLDKIFKYITEESGRIFDPKLVSLFMENKKSILAIMEQYRDP